MTVNSAKGVHAYITRSRHQHAQGAQLSVECPGAYRSAQGLAMWQLLLLAPVIGGGKGS
jgi:hypothetical protein